MSFSSSHSSNHGSHEDIEMSEINMTPLVDVMLVLLIIFMITVPVLTQSVDIELPKIGSTPSQNQPDTISLSVNDLGEYYWNKEAMDLEVLKQRLLEAAEQEPQPQVHIRGDRKTAYEYVVKLMVSAQQAGLTQLGFVTDLGE